MSYSTLDSVYRRNRDVRNTGRLFSLACALTNFRRTAGIPLLANGKISVDLSVENTWHFRTVDSVDRVYTTHFPVRRAGSRQTVHAISTIQRGVLQMPYTMTFASKRNGVEAKTSGIWHGVSTWNLHHEIDIV